MPDKPDDQPNMKSSKHTFSLRFVTRLLWLSLICGWFATLTSADAADIRPLPNAHAHNDYLHTRPLLDALDHGFCSVEVDIWLAGDQLLVAHDRKDAQPDRTLQTIYLDPLLERVMQNHGQVFSNGPAFTLLIDIKSESTNTYIALRKALVPYAAMLTRFELAKTVTNAVTIVVSGNRPRDLMAGEHGRLAAYDGRLSDLDAADFQHLIPLISDNWSLHFKWRATPTEGPLPETERMKLRSLTLRAHQQGRRLRFWGAPDQPAMWRELRDAGVDFLNTDRLAEMREFLTTAKQPARKFR